MLFDQSSLPAAPGTELPGRRHWVAARQHSPVWIHGGLSLGNLLAVDGMLHAIIDFGGQAVGDPSCDLMIGWTPCRREQAHIPHEIVSR
jgi:aminoglycoside phosphotransferase (APT) family kinase protein